MSVAALVELIEQGYRRKAWHGSNLRGALRRVSAKQAQWRPAPGRKCIGEIALHAAYWKYVARRRLTGEKRGSFALVGSNWFALPRRFDDAAWSRCLKLLDEQHRALVGAVTKLSTKAIAATPAGSKVSNLDLLQGIAFHDVYHAGQVQTLKALQKGRAAT